MTVLNKLTSTGNIRNEDSYRNSLTLLLDMMKDEATNPLPKYAENASPVITEKYKKDFVKVLTIRLPDFEKEAKKHAYKK